MYYPLNSQSLDYIKSTLMAGEIIKEVYSKDGILLGYLVIDGYYDPRASNGERSVQIVRCCMNCNNQLPGDHYCIRCKEERRDDLVCKWWTKSTPSRNKLIMKINSKKN